MTEPLLDLKSTPLPRARPVFSGFLPRAGAFLIDCLFLWLIAYLLERFARSALLSLNPWLPLIGYLGAFAYFWLGAGPVGKGRTLGMAVLDIHVVGRDGIPVDWRAALRRTVVQQLIFLATLSPTTRLMAILMAPFSMHYATAIALIVAGVVCLTLLIMLALSVAMHPHKRGWHDLFGGTYITPSPTSSDFHQALAEQLDPIVQKRSAGTVKMTLILWSIASVILLLSPLKDLSTPEARETFQAHFQSQQEVPIPHYAISQLIFPDPRGREYFLDQVQRARAAAIREGRDAPTTDTLRRRAIYDGETTVVECIRWSGAFAPDDFEDDAFREAIENLRLWSWDRFLMLHPTEAPPQKFVVVLVEPLQLFLHDQSKVRARIEGPADPAEGPLNYEEVSSTQDADQ